ncbi:iron uptake transporter permease EfeU [Corynebacterium doosanense]|nr:iron uptake transporter permease EfeU [Corynebacterium doosanense]
MLIGLREGLEASMVVMILVAFLVKSGRKDQLKWVWLGIGAASAVTLTAFLVIQLGTKTLTSTGQELVGGISSLVAVAIISYMLLWMRGAAKDMKGELQGRLGSAVEVGPWAVVLMSFAAVAREGIETALLVFDSFAYGNVGVPAAGLLIGFVVSVIIAVLMYHGAIRINLGVFFKITGVLLIIVAAGILRYGITDLQEAGVLPGLKNHAFDLSGLIAPGSAAATVIEGVLNLVPRPTTLSMIAWALYLFVALFIFLRPVPVAPQPKPEPARSLAACTPVFR